MNVFSSRLFITVFYLGAIAVQKVALAAPLPSPVSAGAQPVVPGQQPTAGGAMQPTVVTPQPMTAQPASGVVQQPTAVVPQPVTAQPAAGAVQQPMTVLPQPVTPQPAAGGVLQPTIVAPPSMGSVSPQSTPSVLPPPEMQAPSKPMVLPPVVDYKKFRDPFKEPSISEVQITKSELERYGVNEFKVTGVITGPIRMRAMLLAPNGKTHYVSENMKLGTRDGVIIKITTKTVVVREKVVNPLGEVELFDTEIGIDQPLSAGMIE